MMGIIINSVLQLWTIICLPIIVHSCGKLIHIDNLLESGEITWHKTSIDWQIMGIILIIFNLTVFVRLWFLKN